MKILITGAAGFLGRGLVVPFEQPQYQLRLMDVVPFESDHEVVIGDVSDYESVANAIEGMDAVIIAHMAPRGENNVNYQTPTMAFDINVKGTANLFHAAVAAGVKKVVVISSTSAIEGHGQDYDDHTLGPKGDKGYYGLSKACQEVIAEQFSREHEMQVACLRVGYILDGDKNMDKYGREIGAINRMDTDRRDIGEVARLCLEDKDLTYDVFHVMSTEEAKTSCDTQYTCTRLNWEPQFKFDWLAKD